MTEPIDQTEPVDQPAPSDDAPAGNPHGHPPDQPQGKPTDRPQRPDPDLPPVGRQPLPREPISSQPTIPSQRSGSESMADPELKRHFIVCGDTTLAYRLATELTTRYEAEVTVIMAAPDAGFGPAIARLASVDIVRSAHPDVTAFERSRIGTAAAIALVGHDDIANVYAALHAQELSPGVRLVLRLHNATLRTRVEALFEDAEVLSDVEIAAPAFVGAALGQVDTTVVRVAGQRAHVARRAEAGDAPVLCDLAVTPPDGDDPVLLPDESTGGDPGRGGEDVADLVLVLDRQGEPEAATAPRPRRSIPRVYRNVRRLLFGADAPPLVGRAILVALGTLAVIAVIGTALFWLTAQREVGNPLSAVYYMIFTAVGAGNPDPALSAWAQAFQTIVALAGVAMLPLISAAIVQAGVHARLALPPGAPFAPERDHVVVVGLGSLGTSVVSELYDRGIETVAIDLIGEPVGASYVRSQRIHFIVGDASRPGTFARANVAGARALLVITRDDVVNLEYALRGRELRGDLNIVLRIFDGDFAERVEDAFGINVSRSVSLIAAPTFAAAMVGREVIATIPVNRSVLLVADIPVVSGSWLDGRRVAEVHEPGRARVIACVADGGRDPRWWPDPETALRVGDRVIVVATRRGLSRLVARSTRAPR